MFVACNFGVTTRLIGLHKSIDTELAKKVMLLFDITSDYRQLQKWVCPQAHFQFLMTGKQEKQFKNYNNLFLNNFFNHKTHIEAIPCDVPLKTNVMANVILFYFPSLSPSCRRSPSILRNIRQTKSLSPRLCSSIGADFWLQVVAINK